MSKQIEEVTVKFSKARKRDGVKPYVVDVRDFDMGRKFFASKRAAQNWLDEVSEEFVDDSDTSDWTVAKLVERFLTQIDRDFENGDRSFSWVQDRKCHCAQLLGLKLHGKKVAREYANKIEYRDVKFELLAQMKNGRSNKTVQNWIGSMIALFDYAIDMKVRESNPFKGTKDGRKLSVSGSGKKTSHAPKAERIHPDVIAQIIEQMDTEWSEITQISCQTGIRQGELRCLTWGDILFEDFKIKIDKAIKHRTQSVGSTKTNNSVRKIPMSSDVQKIFKMIYLRSGRPDSDRLVFPSKSGHFKMPARFVSALHRACDKAGVDRIRWHDLRHFYASMMLKRYKGDDGVWKVSKILGHKTPAITQSIYGHWLEDTDEDEARRDSDEITAVFRRQG